MVTRMRSLLLAVDASTSRRGISETGAADRKSAKKAPDGDVSSPATPMGSRMRVSPSPE